VVQLAPRPWVAWSYGPDAWQVRRKTRMALRVMTSEAVMRRRLGEQVDTATAEETEAVEVAIAATYGLPR
jgi:hypothetical protein